MTNTEKHLRQYKRILIAKIGLDGHDRGAKIILSILKESGYQVLYSGLHKTAEQIAEIAIQEDIDAIGISILSGSHNDLIFELFEELKLKKLGGVLIFAGGTIPNHDIDALKNLGVEEVFPSGADPSLFLAWLDQKLSAINT
jgi:methylmalonyl-CoA mutase C-terminal domain/subunit